MSAFIPMVSTTPPPIDDDDDDDFGDFMDSNVNEKDDFADFSSPKDYDDFSYSSVNPPLQTVGSMDQETDSEEILKYTMPVCDNDLKDDYEDQEMNNTTKTPDKNEDVDIASDFDSFENGNRSQSPCDGNAVEKNSPTCESVNGEGPTSNMESGENNEYLSNGELVDSSKEFIAIVNEQEFPVHKNGNHDISSSGMILEEGFDLRTKNLESNGVNAQQTDNSTTSECDVYRKNQADPAMKISDVDRDAHKVSDNGLDVELADTLAESDEYLSDVGAEIQTICPSGNEVAAEASSPNSIVSLTGVESETSKNTGSYSGADAALEIENSDKSLSITTQAADSRQVHKEIEKQGFTVDESDDVTQPDMTSSIDDQVHDFPTIKSQDNLSGNAVSDQNLSFNANFGDTNDDEDDDFADFGSLATQDFNATENKNSNDGPEAEFNAFENTTASNNQDDGFADFSNADPGQDAHVSDDFGGFSSSNANDSNEFGDFDSGSGNWAEFSETVTKKLTFSEKVNSFVSRYTVEVLDQDTVAQIAYLDEHLTSDTLSKDVESPSTASTESMGIVWSGDLWDQLEDIDNTNALSFVWNGSHHNKYLLDALGMRTQNILFSGTKQAYYVPTYYAAALGMVDPSKGIMKPMSAAEKITAMSPTEKSFPVAGEVSAEESHPEWKTIADEQTSEEGMTVASSWLHSDRTMCNQDDSPISSHSKAVPILSSAMDLDYFDNLPTAPENPKLSGGADLIDPELLEVTSAPTTEPPPPPKDSGSATLSKILASIKRDSNASPLSTSLSYVQNQDDSKWVEEEKILSNEARSVLQRLPDLSYMRSKVLIFPMNMSRMNIGEE